MFPADLLRSVLQHVLASIRAASLSSCLLVPCVCTAKRVLPHVFDVSSGFVWFCLCLLCSCNCLHCHCHAESLTCAVNVEIAAAWILFVILLHAVLLAFTLDAQCFAERSGVMQCFAGVMHFSL